MAIAGVSDTTKQRGRKPGPSQDLLLHVQSIQSVPAFRDAIRPLPMASHVYRTSSSSLRNAHLLSHLSRRFGRGQCVLRNAAKRLGQLILTSINNGQHRTCGLVDNIDRPCMACATASNMSCCAQGRDRIAGRWLCGKRNTKRLRWTLALFSLGFHPHLVTQLHSKIGCISIKPRCTQLSSTGLFPISIAYLTEDHPLSYLPPQPTRKPAKHPPQWSPFHQI